MEQCYKSEHVGLNQLPKRRSVRTTRTTTHRTKNTWPGSLPQKAAAPSKASTANYEVIDLTKDEEMSVKPKQGKKRKAEEATDSSQPDEKRLRRYRDHPPQTFFEVYNRAMTQRFYVLDRTRCGTDKCPEEKIEMTGSTGNVYTVHVARKPTCTCPHSRKGNQCKHYIYAMSRVLRASFNHVYQLAFLTTELREIFAAAPAIETHDSSASARDKNRKPIDGDCPICFMDLEPTSQDKVVWCKAACGQNFHQGCFETWARTKRQSGGFGGRSEVTCPLCRTLWEGDDDMMKCIMKPNRLNSEGYVNVSDQLGINPVRDWSTYYSGPSRRSYMSFRRY